MQSTQTLNTVWSFSHDIRCIFFTQCIAVDHPLCEVPAYSVVVISSSLIILSFKSTGWIMFLIWKLSPPSRTHPALLILTHCLLFLLKTISKFSRDNSKYDEVSVVVHFIEKLLAHKVLHLITCKPIEEGKRSIFIYLGKDEF